MPKNRAQQFIEDDLEEFEGDEDELVLLDDEVQ
jgi:hypothetical protein